MPLIDCFNNQKSINYYINTIINLGHSATGYAVIQVSLVFVL